MIAASAWPDWYIHPHCRPCRHDHQSHLHINRLHIVIIFTLYCNTEPAPSPPDQSLRKSLSLRVWWKINIWNITSEVRGGRSKMKISDPRSAKNLKIRSWPRNIFIVMMITTWASSSAKAGPCWEPPQQPRSCRRSGSCLGRTDSILLPGNQRILEVLHDICHCVLLFPSEFELVWIGCTRSVECRLKNLQRTSSLCTWWLLRRAI